MASPVAIYAAMAVVAYALLPPDVPAPTGTGHRVVSETETSAPVAARCIAYNINKKMPALQVRTRTDDSADGSIYLVLTNPDPSPTTFGVIRVEPRTAGTHLTTWLPEVSLTAAPEVVARRLIAGC